MLGAMSQATARAGAVHLRSAPVRDGSIGLPGCANETIHP